MGNTHPVQTARCEQRRLSPKGPSAPRSSFRRTKQGEQNYKGPVLLRSALAELRKDSKTKGFVETAKSLPECKAVFREQSRKVPLFIPRPPRRIKG